MEIDISQSYLISEDKVNFLISWDDTTSFTYRRKQRWTFVCQLCKESISTQSSDLKSVYKITKHAVETNESSDDWKLLYKKYLSNKSLIKYASMNAYKK